MKRLLRTAALLALLLAAKCPHATQTAEQPYEDPAECKCRVVSGKKVCNSACSVD